jgi:hypothetical protein
MSLATSETSMLINSDELIDETDDLIYEHINSIVHKEMVRIIPPSVASEKIRDVSGIIETLQCALCMSVTVQP